AAGMAAPLRRVQHRQHQRASREVSVLLPRRHQDRLTPPFPSLSPTGGEGQGEGALSLRPKKFARPNRKGSAAVQFPWGLTPSPNPGVGPRAGPVPRQRSTTPGHHAAPAHQVEHRERSAPFVLFRNTARERIMNPPTLGIDDEPGWKICLKCAQWAGRIAALFTFAFIITAIVFCS